jgi:dihydropteroate synthase
MTIDDLSIRYPNRATTWQLRTRTLALPRRPLLMGIVNITPDSFSDGGKFLDPQPAIEHALKLVDEGADLLDIGGESTRPYATPVDAHEELRRVLPVIEAICLRTRTPVSIDTSKPQVAAAALAAGAEIINDITGFSDPAMVEVARDNSAGVCAMHMQGTPQTMQDQPTYGDVVEEVFDYLSQRRAELVRSGIAPRRICLDPGIGFGKTHQHNLTLAAHCDRFHDQGQPVLVGHSRKGFIGKVLGDKAADRADGNIGVALALARQGVQLLRVHDIRPIREALLLFEAVGGIDGRVWEGEAPAEP